ncbi:unnamed protein product [Adineta ricciae]|uniref:Uncharacterized protein n=2 Tax=Adineta ricciae TaxID=249248 RepID=A0A814KLV5_ADIRI|nr:unnamed protein product [Adineta ricciae]CAF1346850.1 unnamed protein product [Adineta ricciae]
MRRSVEQLKYLDRMSRHIRHHQTTLYHRCNQLLSHDLDALTHEYAQNLKHSKKQYQIEQQRKEILDYTIQQIANEQNHHSLPSIDTVEMNKENVIIPSENVKLPPIQSHCHLSPCHCSLYPCQPIYHYTSFMSKDRDQTLQQRNSTQEYGSEINHFQNLLAQLEKKEYHPKRRQMTIAMGNQRRSANRHAYMMDIKTRLDEQSRLLQEQLVGKRTFGYKKEQQNELHRAIKRHLEISAKFCA